MSTIFSLITEGRAELAGVSETPGLDAELLLGSILGCSRAAIVANPEQAVGPGPVELYRSLIARRKESEPVAYLLGNQEFWSLNFTVTPDVLIPRPETELIIERAIAEAAAMADPLRILDLGTGSGCIAIAVAKELLGQGRELSVIAVDASAAALIVACENVDRHGLSDTVRIVEGDWFAPFRAGRHVFDLILSNPPYIAESDPQVSASTAFEPRAALYSSTDGLAALRRLIDEAPKFLAPGGVVLFEHGFAQRAALTQLLAGPQYKQLKPQFHQDLAGRDRVLELRFGAERITTEV